MFITPDYRAWNPHSLSYDNHEVSILDFKGITTEMFKQSSHQAVFEDGDGDPDALISMATFQTSAWNNSIDSTISFAFISSPYEFDNDINLETGFCNALNLRGEISKFSASIGSCNICSDDLLFNMNKPTI